MAAKTATGRTGPGRDTTAAPGIWIDVYQGEPLRYEKLLEDLATAAVVYLGEFHTVQRATMNRQSGFLPDLCDAASRCALGTALTIVGKRQASSDGSLTSNSRCVWSTR